MMQPIAISSGDVARRLLRAILTLKALPDPEARWQHVKAMWPHDFEIMTSLIKSQIMRPDRRRPRLKLRYADLDDYHVGPEDYEPQRRRFQPTNADVSDCLNALKWFAKLHVVDQTVVTLVAHDFDFRSIGRRAEHEAFRAIGKTAWAKRYDRGPREQTDDWARDRYAEAILYCVAIARAEAAEEPRHRARRRR